jgi:hypothetical protein
MFTFFNALIITLRVQVLEDLGYERTTQEH